MAYNQLKEEVLKVEVYLEDKKDIGIILCDNTIGFVFLYLAFIDKGIVPLLLASNISDASLKKYINQYNVRYVCLPSRVISKFYLMLKRKMKVRDYLVFQREIKKGFNINNNLALLLTTSGSTGNMKCVRISKDNLLCNTQAICNTLKIEGSQRAITSLPMNYTYGLSVLHTHLYAKATILLTNLSFLSPNFWGFFEKEGGTSFSGVPFTYENMYKFGFTKKKYSSLNVLTQAGGKMPSEMLQIYGQYALNNNIQLYIMYGQTEATARMSILDYNSDHEKIGSVGKAIEGGRFEIINDEVVYYGKNVSMGYAKKASDLLLDDNNNGVLFTGDLGYLDGEFLYLLGRKDRFVKINGVRVFLKDIEDKAYQIFNGEVAITWKNEKLTFFCQKFSEIGWENLKKIIKKDIPLSERQMIRVFVEEIPRTFDGKINYGELEKYKNDI